MSKIFVDTNIFVYSFDRHHTDKMRQSRMALKILQKDHLGVISTQVMQELYVVATRKLHVAPLLVKDIIKNLEHLEVITVTPEIIYEAIDLQQSKQLSFWDALIVSTALYAKCDFIWTEDLNTGQWIRNVQIVNPLAE